MAESTTRRNRSRRAEREGAAMFVVMALLLIVTATGTLAIHSTSIELRGVGNARQAMQTRYVAEGALTSTLAMFEGSPAILDISLQRSESGEAGERELGPDDPPMAQDRAHHRVFMADFASAPRIVGQPFAADSLGRGMSYVPNFAVDLNDRHATPRTVAGDASGEMRSRNFFEVTSTARGRTQLPGRADAYSRVDREDLERADENWTQPRGFHESAVNARVTALFSAPLQ